MKKIHLIPALALLMGACANENLSVNPDTPTTQLSGEVTGYVNVQIVMPGSVNSRADASYSDSYDKEPGTYLDGTKKENNVKTVRFYFFDENGKAVKVRKNPNSGSIDYYTYIDWTPAASEDPTLADDDNGLHNGTIEKQYKTTLVLSQPKTAEGKELPKRIVAVVNPPQDVIQLYDFSVKTGDGTDLEYLADLVADYATDYTNENFVMTNSVYADNGLINYSEIETIESSVTPPAGSESIADDSDSEIGMASATIFVERVVARVDFSINLKAENYSDIPDYNNYASSNIYNIGKAFGPTKVTDVKDDKDMKENEVDIYLQVEGWALASYPTNSYLVKHINPSWGNLFKDEANPWNADNYRRSFWAINPKEMTYNFYSFNEITKNGNAPDKATDTGFNSIYTQENANPYEDGISTTAGKMPEAPTQVIFVGTLGELKDGKVTPLTLCEYRGKQYTEAGLKQLICNDLNLYSDNACENRVTPEQLKFITQSEWLNLGETNLDPNPSTEETLPEQGSYQTRDGESTKPVLESTIDAETLNKAIPGRYYSFLVPVNDNQEWWRLVGGQPEKVEADMAQYIYESLNYARIKVWKDGKTYFYHNIRHLGKKDESPAEFGVVRNHIYNVAFTKILGFGTPVLNPDEPIYPEQPQGEADDVEVTINILSWRLVSEDYEVSW